MTRDEAYNLKNGLYLIAWKSGGSSLAAVGRRSDGSVWIAPCNWINLDDTTNHWNEIQHVRVIEVDRVIGDRD